MTNSVPITDAASRQRQSDESKAKILGQTVDPIQKDDENIYLSLDTILDTRMGTLAKMGTEHAVRALNSGRYHKRMIDEFDNIPKGVFKEAYQQRDLETLKLSLLTNLVFFLRRLIKDSLISAIMNQKVEKMCFTVNTHPYDFSDPELVDMLIGCIRFHTYSTASVRIVSIPDEELTPKFCAENFQIMIMYEWLTWVDKHRADFEKYRIPGTAIVVPEIFSDSVPTLEDIDRLDLRKKNPFRLTEEIVAGMFRLKHMPVSLFSIHEKINKDNAADIAKRVTVTQNDIEEYLNKNHPKATLIHDTPLPAVDLDDAYTLL